MTPLMGRSAQLAWIEEQLAAGGSIVIAGEAGVGKTRLMTEVVDRVAALGRPVSRIVAARSGAALPLAPLAHLLPPDIDPEGGLGALRQALDAFAALGDGRILTIGIDDAHHLDDLSLLIVQQALAAEVLQIVATLRSGEQVTPAVEQLWRGPGGARLDLQPLDPVATAALVEAVLGGPADTATHALIDQAASGSPLMILELVAHGRATDRLAEDQGLWRWRGDLGVNPRLAELVGFSLDRLSPAERVVVEVVALAEPLPVGIVEAIGPPGVAAGLEARGVLVPGAEPGLVRPGHPLIGEAALAALKPLQRRHLLGRLLDAYETYGTDAASRRRGVGGAIRPDDRTRLALWALDADRPVDITELRAAARLARARQANAECEQLARAAFEQEPDVGMGVLVGFMLHLGSRFDEAEQFYERTAALVVTDEDLIDLTVKRSTTLRFGFGRHDDAAALLEDARGRIRDPALAWELVATEARHAVLAGRATHIPALWAEAAGAPERARYALAESAAAALGSMGRLRECAEVETWVADAAARQQEHQPTVLPLVQFWLTASLAIAGDIETAEAMVRPVYDAAARGGLTLQQAYLSTTLAISRLLAGDMLAAEQLGREAALAPPSSRTVRMVGLATLARALLGQGRLTNAADVLSTIETERDPGLRTADLFERLAIAQVAHSRGQERAALEGLDDAFHEAVALGTLPVAMHAAFDLIRLGGRRATIEEAVRVARGVEGSLGDLVGGYGRAILGSDADGLVTVADRASSAGLHLVEVAALTSAIAIEQEDGHAAAAAQVAERRRTALARCPGLVVVDGPVDLGLSERERDIATRAAQGTPDKRIAADLGISVRTVNAHLRSVYSKLGVSSRLDLATVPGLDATLGSQVANEP